MMSVFWLAIEPQRIHKNCQSLCILPALVESSFHLTAAAGQQAATRFNAYLLWSTSEKLTSEELTGGDLRCDAAQAKEPRAFASYRSLKYVSFLLPMLAILLVTIALQL